MANPVPYSLTALTPREAVADAIHRCVLGIDTNNQELFESACLKNESMTFVAGPFDIKGWTAVNELTQKAFAVVTTHIISNIRVELEDGADTASMTAHAISYHVRPEDTLKQEDTSYTAGSLYNLGLVRDSDDGLWKIKKWEVKILWTTGDPAVLHGVSTAMATTRSLAPYRRPVLRDSGRSSARAPKTQQTLRPEPKFPCGCSGDPTGDRPCVRCSVKRHVEPLAWNLEHDSVVTQSACPLFTKIPKELRDTIFEYALTIDAEQVARVERSMFRVTWPDRPHYDPKDLRDLAMSKSLLLTCRAVYLETFLLPIHLNPLRIRGSRWFRPKVMLPWQFANIQALDFILPQKSLEDGALYKFLFGFEPTAWHPEARHRGVLVAPYLDLKDRIGGSRRSCNCTLLPTGADTDRCSLTDALDQIKLPASFVAPSSTMRLQRARPLVHLTLRLSARNWWTWCDDPSSNDASKHHLGLDPALGNGTADLSQRPTSTRMQELAQQRRDGYHPAPRSLPWKHAPGWAHIIARLPDLKTLELNLETFGEKKGQLEKVVECAKSWRFPIANTDHCLAWDTRLEEKKWSSPVVEDREFQKGYWYARSTEFEVRIMRFTRRRVAPKTMDED